MSVLSEGCAGEPKQKGTASFVREPWQRRQFYYMLKSHVSKGLRLGKIMIWCSSRISPFMLPGETKSEGSITCIFCLNGYVWWWGASMKMEESSYVDNKRKKWVFRVVLSSPLAGAWILTKIFPLLKIPFPKVPISYETYEDLMKSWIEYQGTQ